MARRAEKLDLRKHFYYKVAQALIEPSFPLLRTVHVAGRNPNSVHILESHRTLARQCIKCGQKQTTYCQSLHVSAVVLLDCSQLMKVGHEGSSHVTNASLSLPDWLMKIDGVRSPGAESTCPTPGAVRVARNLVERRQFNVPNLCSGNVDDSTPTHSESSILLDDGSPPKS